LNTKLDLGSWYVEIVDTDEDLGAGGESVSGDESAEDGGCGVGEGGVKIEWDWYWTIFNGCEI
jgi:hypothetical protein